MLTLLKRNPEQSVDEGRAWHSNFRNVAELPDIKVVRTAFFLNSLSVMVLVGAGLLFVHQEYNLAALRKEIADAEARIQGDKKASDQAIAVYKKFEEEDAKIAELDAFHRGNKVDVSDFIMRIGQLLPKRMAITAVEYNELAIVVRGMVSGSTEVVSVYEKEVKEDPVVRPLFESISVTNLSREAEGARFTFELSLKFPKKDGKKP